MTKTNTPQQVTTPWGTTLDGCGCEYVAVDVPGYRGYVQRWELARTCFTHERQPANQEA